MCGCVSDQKQEQNSSRPVTWSNQVNPRGRGGVTGRRGAFKLKPQVWLNQPDEPSTLQKRRKQQQRQGQLVEWN